MCEDYDYFFDRARIAEEMRKNRKKTHEPTPQADAAPAAPAAEPKPTVKEQDVIPV